MKRKFQPTMSAQTLAPHSIPEFFNGKSILITGGTGFLGRVLIEKLLRSCPQITAIYLLLREKKGKSPKARLSDVVDIPVREIVLLFAFFVLFLRFLCSYLID